MSEKDEKILAVMMAYEMSPEDSYERVKYGEQIEKLRSSLSDRDIARIVDEHDKRVAKKVAANEYSY